MFFLRVPTDGRRFVLCLQEFCFQYVRRPICQSSVLAFVLTEQTQSFDKPSSVFEMPFHWG
jgi:hypothetical protein